RRARPGREPTRAGRARSREPPRRHAAARCGRPRPHARLPRRPRALDPATGGVGARPPRSRGAADRPPGQPAPGVASPSAARPARPRSSRIAPRAGGRRPARHPAATAAVGSAPAVARAVGATPPAARDVRRTAPGVARFPARVSRRGGVQHADRRRRRVGGGLAPCGAVGAGRHPGGVAPDRGPAGDDQLRLDSGHHTTGVPRSRGHAGARRAWGYSGGARRAAELRGQARRLDPELAFALRTTRFPSDWWGLGLTTGLAEPGSAVVLLTAASAVRLPLARLSAHGAPAVHALELVPERLP